MSLDFYFTIGQNIPCSRVRSADWQRWIYSPRKLSETELVFHLETVSKRIATRVATILDELRSFYCLNDNTIHVQMVYDSRDPELMACRVTGVDSDDTLNVITSITSGFNPQNILDGSFVTNIDVDGVLYHILRVYM